MFNLVLVQINFPMKYYYQTHHYNILMVVILWLIELVREPMQMNRGITAGWERHAGSHARQEFT